jgi:hypothetical protein
MKNKNVVNTLDSETIIVSKKRGRKPKKDIKEELNKEVDDNINIIIEETSNKQIYIQNINDLLVIEENENENDNADRKRLDLHVPRLIG